MTDEIACNDLAVTLALKALSTLEHKAIAVQHLVDICTDHVGASYFDLDMLLFGSFIEFAEGLSRPQRLTLALSLLTDLLIAEQAKTPDSSALLPIFSRHITL